MAECSVFYKKVIDRLVAEGITDPDDFFLAGIFVGICEQVAMQVKPAGMIEAQTARCESITKLIAQIYRLELDTLVRNPSGDTEIWVFRRDDAETREGVEALKSGNLGWAEYHGLRGRLCGYSEQLIKAYTEGVWP